MRKIIVPAAAAFAFAMALAAPAYADEADFYSAIESSGLVADDGALAMGQAVCNEIAAGVPEGTTVVAIYTNTGNDITAEHAQALYDAAAANLCE